MPKRRSINPHFNKRLQRATRGITLPPQQAQPVEQFTVGLIPDPPDPEQLQAQQTYRQTLLDINPTVISAKEKRRVRALKRLALCKPRSDG